jgi:hypothetical protein
MKEPYIDEYDDKHILRDVLSENFVNIINSLMKSEQIDAVNRILSESGFSNTDGNMLNFMISNLTLINKVKENPNFATENLNNLNNKEYFPTIKNAKIDGNSIVIEFTAKSGFKNLQQKITPISFIYDMPENYGLNSEERFGKCHIYSLLFCNNVNEKCKILTGYIYGLSERAEYLHSWVETTENNQNYVYDMTMNAKMSKELYYYIKKARPIKSLTQNYVKEHIEEVIDILDSNRKITVKEFMLYPDEFLEKYSKQK